MMKKSNQFQNLKSHSHPWLNYRTASGSMKGLSRKKFSQVGRRLCDLVLCSQPLKLAGAVQLPLPLLVSSRSTYQRATQLSLPDSQFTQPSRSDSTLTATPLIDRFFLCLCLSRFE